MERFKIITAVHLILIENERVLLLRRYNTGYEDVDLIFISDDDGLSWNLES